MAVGEAGDFCPVESGFDDGTHNLKIELFVGSVFVEGSVELERVLFDVFGEIDFGPRRMGTTEYLVSRTTTDAC